MSPTGQLSLTSYCNYQSEYEPPNIWFILMLRENSICSVFYIFKGKECMNHHDSVFFCIEAGYMNSAHVWLIKNFYPKMKKTYCHDVQRGR